ncbi:hypothetical protein N658DRAFT_72063 [Parathielavia hyrcaniae]|uniref:Fungal N-terminal domain-containing protein n=1 Tax=Parathielavia hyrcaniae TaxID=113614 RepID=A0AAN6T261_9PEZI|nr:hypothetical protein N658DRAFT_72063 [Parathielavia hyrcaniae]
MDPLSITASAIALAANVLRSAAYIKNAADEYRNGPSVTRDIEHEVKIVQAALRQVEAVLQRDAQAMSRLGLQDVFQISVAGCRDTLQRIGGDFEALFGRRDWRVRLAVWWNGGEIRRLLATLDTKKGSLMLLVQALSLHSVQDLQELLQQNTRTLDLARLGLDGMVHSYPAYTSRELDSVASAIGSEDSVLGDRESVVSTTRFDFDSVCFTSKAYRHTIERILNKKTWKWTRGKTAEACSKSPALPSVNETDETAVTPPPSIESTSRPSVTAEEHEAVVKKLREAEALIQLLNERNKQLVRTGGKKDCPRVAASFKRPVLPAPTETNPTVATGTPSNARADVSKSGDEQSSPRVPDGGTDIPDTITAGRRASRPHTSLNNECFDSGKAVGTSRAGEQQKSSVRVIPTPTTPLSTEKLSSSEGRPGKKAGGLAAEPGGEGHGTSESQRRLESVEDAIRRLILPELQAQNTSQDPHAVPEPSPNRYAVSKAPNTSNTSRRVVRPSEERLLAEYFAPANAPGANVQSTPKSLPRVPSAPSIARRHERRISTTNFPSQDQQMLNGPQDAPGNPSTADSTHRLPVLKIRSDSCQDRQSRIFTSGWFPRMSLTGPENWSS